MTNRAASEFLRSPDHHTHSTVRRTGLWIGLLVIGLFVGTFLAKWWGILPAPLQD